MMSKKERKIILKFQVVIVIMLRTLKQFSQDRTKSIMNIALSQT